MNAAPPLLLEALAHERAGRPAEMERCLRALLRQQPDLPAALFALARLGLRYGHAGDALTLLDRALVRAPAAAELHHLRGHALLGLGRRGEALAALTRAADLAPGAVEPALDLARLLTEAERFEAALARLESLTGPSPAHGEAALLRGRIQAVLGQAEAARAAFESALTIATAAAEARAELAAQEIEADRPAAALDRLEPLLADEPAPPRPLYLRGVALGMLGRAEESEADIARLRATMLEGLARRNFQPVELYLQISRRCNLRCAMCGHAVWRETGGLIDDSSFARVLDRCDEAGIRRLNLLAAQGEPFLHPQAEALIERAVARGLAVSVVTNGIPLNPERIARLAASGLDSVQFSFAGWDAASYESVYVGARFERAVANLQALDAALAPTRTTLSVKAVRADNDPAAVARTRAFLAGLGISSVATVVPNNFGGTVETGRFWPGVGLWSHRNLDRHRRTVCRLLMRAVGVYLDGSVTACPCYDANGALRIGDLTGQSVAEIRTGPAFQAILDAFRRGDLSAVPLCRGCDDPFG
ncbi:radical SAM protein [Phaeospirillum tilakii]|uniref:Radical SAM protein n=1 Tax=Phaeospirillum tilakii TaxID=741673 RepID=A0ABW5CA68_9PROT